MQLVTISKDSIKEISITEVIVGFYILNLGVVLEIAEEKDLYVVVILRMNEKHVFRYPKNVSLWVYPNAIQNV